MGRFEKSIVIQASLENVWDMLALDNLSKWMEGYEDAKSVEYTSEVRTVEDKYRVGASAYTRIKGAGELDLEITESCEHETMTYRMKGSRGMNTRVTYLLEPVEEGTKIDYVMDYDVPWGLFGKFSDKLFAQFFLEKEVERSLRKLKRFLEQ